jgi:phosphatidylglycerol lysyltransferase
MRVQANSALVSPRARRSPPELIVEIPVEHGLDSMSFLAVESGMRHWLDDQAPDSGRSCVAYVETPHAWVAACSPVVNVDAAASVRDLQRTALRFLEAARSNGKRACFFACEALAAGGLPRLLIGEQPIFHPREWLSDLAKHRRLREQLRRARAKGLTVRGVAPAELEKGSLLRAEVEGLASDWLRSRHIEPMGFLV